MSQPMSSHDIYVGVHAHKGRPIEEVDAVTLVMQLKHSFSKTLKLGLPSETTETHLT